MYVWLVGDLPRISGVVRSSIYTVRVLMVDCKCWGFFLKNPGVYSFVVTFVVTFVVMVCLSWRKHGSIRS